MYPHVNHVGQSVLKFRDAGIFIASTTYSGLLILIRQPLTAACSSRSKN